MTWVERVCVWYVDVVLVDRWSEVRVNWGEVS